jgi:hypothetical protein
MVIIWRSIVAALGFRISQRGKYSHYHEAIHCVKKRTLFQTTGRDSSLLTAVGLYGDTFFGNDPEAPWREEPAIVKMVFYENGILHPDLD